MHKICQDCHGIGLMAEIARSFNILLLTVTIFIFNQIPSRARDLVILHENISTAILPLLRTHDQEALLSVTGERMCSKY